MCVGRGRWMGFYELFTQQKKLKANTSEKFDRHTSLATPGRQIVVSDKTEMGSLTTNLVGLSLFVFSFLQIRVDIGDINVTCKYQPPDILKKKKKRKPLRLVFNVTVSYISFESLLTVHLWR